MKSVLRFGIMLTAAATWAACAGAVGPREACRQDAQSFCSDVQPGGGRILDCLQDHYKDISENCYVALQTMQQRRQGQGNGGGSYPPPPPPPPPGEDGNDRPPPPPPPREDGNNAPPPPPPGDGVNGDPMQRGNDANDSAPAD